MKVSRKIQYNINVYLAIKIIQTKLIRIKKNRFKNPFKFSSNDINKFILLLIKGVYPSEYMGEWEKFNKTLLPETS